VQIKTKVGVALIATGLLIFGAYILWDDTRERTPLNIPIQISPGSVAREDFSVNVSGPYVIRIEAQKKIDFDALNCLLDMRIDLSKKCQAAEVVQSQWVVMQGERVVASGSSSGDHGGYWANDTVAREIGSFVGRSGHAYHLEVKFLNDGKALSEASPRLFVAVDSDVKDDLFRLAFVLLACAVPVLIGCVLLISSAIVRLRRSRPGASGTHS
jgi:hypothetical protein